MARHRNVRTMNYEDEYYDEDDMYGHSVEDNYCISPGTAAQFTFNRDRGMDLSTFMRQEEGIPEEDEEEEGTPRDQHRGSVDYTRPPLSDIQEANLNSCLEEIRSILGESVPENTMIDTVIKNNFNLEASLNELLSQQDAPKPQREPRTRRNRSLEFEDIECDGPDNQCQTPDLDYDSSFTVYDNPFIPKAFAGGEMKFGCVNSESCESNEKEHRKYTSLSVISKAKGGESRDVQQSNVVEKPDGIKEESDVIETTYDYIVGRPCKSKTLNDNVTVTRSDISERMKSLSEHVSKMTLKNTTPDHPLSPNSDKENIPLQGNKLGYSNTTPESKLTTGESMGGVLKQGLVDQIVNQSQSEIKAASSVPTGKQTQVNAISKTQGLSLAQLARIHESKTVKENTDKTLVEFSGKQKPSLAELTKSQKVQAETLTSVGFHNQNSGKITEPNSWLGPSLTGLTVKQQESKIGMRELPSEMKEKVQNVDLKPSLAELAKKYDNKTQFVGSLCELRRAKEGQTPNSNSKFSLAELAKRHKLQEQREKTTVSVDKNEKSQTCNTKPSLAELIMRHETHKQMEVKQTCSNDSNGMSDSGSNQKLSLLTIGNRTNAGSLSQLSVNQKDTEKCSESSVSGPKLSLTDLANTCQKQNENKPSLSALSSQHDGYKDKKATSNISLEQLAKKNALKGCQRVQEGREEPVDTASQSLKKLKILDKTDGLEKSEKVLGDIQRSVESEVTGYSDNLVIAQVSKFTNQASKLGRIFCLKVKANQSGKDEFTLRNYKMKRFSYQSQIKGRKKSSPIGIRKIIPYDFSDPSPDDIVKLKQKAAFSRTRERKESD